MAFFRYFCRKIYRYGREGMDKKRNGVLGEEGL